MKAPQQTEATREKLRELKALGVSLAVDDFGTGYSSLGYLHRFPIDVLKVDRQFVENVDEGSGQAAKIAKTIVNLAQNLDLTTIAEGIEREAQVRALAGLGCEDGQGFLFARPSPADAFRAADAAVRTAFRFRLRCGCRNHGRGGSVRSTNPPLTCGSTVGLTGFEPATP